jgi:2-amino-4-hydroxy-6-hydroxymethyldihydropteridine diphosphokinase
MAIHNFLVAVGSNLGDRREAVQRAMQMLRERGMTIEAESELVETAPIGAADLVFLNGAFICRGDIEPDDFMRLLLDVEDRLGRVRDQRWGNRVIDLDILLVRNESGTSIECQSAILTAPHPRLLERDFMLRPAAAVAGHWVLPFSDQNLRALCVSRGWRPTWNNLKGDIKFWQALKGDIYAATTSRLWWPVLMMTLIWRLWLSGTVPFGNDEAYYWDWGRNPMLSYFDHPPFVSWIAMFSRLLVFTWTEGPLQGRFLVPFIHLLTTLLFGALVVRLMRRVLTNLESRAVLLITQLVPAFSLGGVMLMPDVGLILFSTFAAWLALAMSRRAHLRWWNGVLLGVVLGFAGLSKYHAALIGGGLLAWLFWTRQESFDEERPFWACLICSGLLTILPVIAWNASHEWASFRFQGSRGVSGGGFEFRRAMRTLAGELVFLGPLVITGFIRFARLKTKPWERDASIILWAALPMLIILKIFSFTTQTLPHWSMPSLWLLCVLIVPIVAASSGLRWTARSYGIVFCVVLPGLLSTVESRRAMLRWLGNRPGGLGELTLWSAAATDRDFLAYLSDQSWLASSVTRPEKCGDQMTFAAPRWFTAAQAAANLPGHPVVENLDPDHLSYYHYRSRSDLSGCPVIILSEVSHWRAAGWSGIDPIVDSREFEIDGHRDRRVVVARAWWSHDQLNAGQSQK